MIKSSGIILLIILASFLIRGIFLVAVFPIFKGQDESRHYNTVQYLATGESRDCQKRQAYFEQNKKDLSTYHYSDEIKKAALITQHKQIRGEYYDKVDFTNSNNGYQEVEFKKNKYSKIQHVCPPDVATSAFGKDSFSLYQHCLARVEILLSQQNIFIRYSLLRVISVLLGVITLILAYSVFKAVNFSEKQSLILTMIISFQPKLVTYFTNINYDVLLIPLWTGFIFAGILILKRGWNFGRAIVLLGLLVGAVITKPTALSLFGLGLFLLVVTLYKKISSNKSSWFFVGGFVFIGCFISYLLLNKTGLISIFSGEYLNSIGEYLSVSLSKIDGSSKDYWGVIRWRSNNLTNIYVQIIWIIEWVAWVGIFFLIVSSVFSKVFKQAFFKWQQKFFRKLIIGYHRKKGIKRGPLATIVAGVTRKSGQYLQQLDMNVRQDKKQNMYVWFMLVAIIVLQITIRVADWKMFTSCGEIILGTPGRYWLPNIVPHFVTLAIGLNILIKGFVKNKINQKNYFELVLLAFLILMVLYWTYEVIDVIIPRFYL